MTKNNLEYRENTRYVATETTCQECDPTYQKSARPGPTGKGREGVNPSPGGRGVLGRRILWEGMPLNHRRPEGWWDFISPGVTKSGQPAGPFGWPEWPTGPPGWPGWPRPAQPGQPDPPGRPSQTGQPTGAGGQAAFAGLARLMSRSS